MKKPTKLSRRDFVQTALGTGVALTAPTFMGATAKGQGKTFKIGLIGCGGRGRGAVARPSVASAARAAIGTCLRPM